MHWYLAIWGIMICAEKSLVCKGGKYKNWVHQSTYLSQYFQIPHTPDNESLLHACPGRMMNPAILDKTIKNSNTQMVRSFNRTLRRSLSRNVTFTRNFSGREHSAAHPSNHGPGNSIRGLCSGVGAAIPTGGSVDKALDEKSS